MEPTPKIWREVTRDDGRYCGKHRGNDEADILRAMHELYGRNAEYTMTPCEPVPQIVLPEGLAYVRSTFAGRR